MATPHWVRVLAILARDRVDRRGAKAETPARRGPAVSLRLCACYESRRTGHDTDHLTVRRPTGNDPVLLALTCWRSFVFAPLRAPARSLLFQREPRCLHLRRRHSAVQNVPMQRTERKRHRSAAAAIDLCSTRLSLFCET
jgi:hypothetical protein